MGRFSLKPGSLAWEIMKFLIENKPRKFSAKEVSFALKKDYNNVRVTMNRLRAKRQITKPTRGYFCALLTIEDILRGEKPALSLHGIKIKGKIPIKENLPLWRQGLPKLLQWESKKGAHNEYWQCSNLAFMGRQVIIQVFDNLTILISLSSSKNPINPSELTEFSGWLDGILLGQTVLMDLYVVQCGLGYDFFDFRMDGMTAMRWKAFKNAYFELYQKTPDQMRLAMHINTTVTLQDACIMLNAMSNTELPIHSVTELQKAIKKDTDYIG